MSAADKVPWTELALTSDECAELWGLTKEHWLATIACRPDFPVRLTMRPATWKAGEVVEWRNANRSPSKARGRQGRAGEG